MNSSKRRLLEIGAGRDILVAMNQPAALTAFEGARPHKISAGEFWQMTGAGVFGDRRIELVEGDLIEMAPSQRPHGEFLARITHRMMTAYGDADWLFFVDTYVGLGPTTVRAPDFSVIARSTDDGTELEGASIVLAVEVSDTTLREDLGRKRAHYAAARVQNYWAIDIDGRCVHQFGAADAGDFRQVDKVGFGTAMKLPGVQAVVVID
jgi:Uma2 family endonuclease